MGQAPRQPKRFWGGCARGALTAVCLWLAMPVAGVAQQIVSARYDGPTTRYPHGALGDAIEHDTLVVGLSDGRSMSARWDRPLVFEDEAPRVVDLDRDGSPEVIVVESHEDFGARLSVWGLVDGALALRAATPFIGTRFRWLAPVGAADLDGDGLFEIAYIDRPHLAKTLRIWRFVPTGEGANLEPVVDYPGVTNHQIGWADIPGGIRDCGQGPEMIVADARWSRVLAVTLRGGRIAATDIGPWQRGALDAALTCD